MLSLIGKALRLLLFFQSLQKFSDAATQCGSNYQTKCSVEVGKVILNTANSKPFVVSENRLFYVSFPAPSPSVAIDLGFTMFYGSIEIYTAFDKEPKLDDFQDSNLIHGESDFLRIMPTYNAVGMINVMVKAVGGAASFTGVFSTTSKPNQLISGFPQNFHVTANTVYKANMLLNSKDNSSVLLSPFTQTDVTLSLKLPSSAMATSTKDYAIIYTPQQSDVGKTAEIAFVAKNNTVVNLVWREGNLLDIRPINLVDGTVHADIIEARRTSHYYLFTVPPNIEHSVAILLDCSDGDTDLYVNPTHNGFYHREYLYNPSKVDDDYPVWSSSHPLGRDKVVIEPSDPNYIANGGVYYISVYAFAGPARFTLRIVLDDTVTTLVEGVSLQDSLTAHSYHYYRFYDSNPSQSIEIDVNPSVGDADVMVACKLIPTGDDTGYPSKAFGHYNVSSVRYLEDAVSISPSDPNSCSYGATEGGRVFYIAVYGYSDSTYTITAMHSGGIQRIYPGIPISSTIFKGLQHFYRLYSSSESQDLTIQLVPQYGDCDLYMKVGSAPSLGVFDVRSSNIGRAVDSIHIPETDICTNCWIYLMVYGFESTKYILTALFQETVLQLVDGVPLRDSVAARDIQYYVYETTRYNSSVNVVLTVVSGGVPNIYMSPIIPNPNATTPSTLVAISLEDPIPTLTLSYVVPPEGLVFIGVGDVNANSSYYIRINEIATPAAGSSALFDSTPSILSLLEGIPQVDALPVFGGIAFAENDRRKWIYYEILVPSGHETIKVRGYPTLGSFAMYIVKCGFNSTYLCAHHTLPNSTFYSYSMTVTSGKMLPITRNDPSPAIYLLGVHSTTPYASYQLSYSLEHSILELQAGVAVMDTVTKGEIDYFSFYLSETMDTLRFVLTTMSGDPDIYISTSRDHPSESNYTWRSIHFGSDTIEINTLTDASACAPCNYYIAVIGTSASTYSLQVTVKSSVPVLQDGVPQSGSVQKGKISYFIFYGHSSFVARDYEISMTSDTGNADLYVTLDSSVPSTTNYAYNSNNWYSVDIIDIMHSDNAYNKTCLPIHGHEKVCPIKIAVVGIEASEFTITVTSSVASKLLQLGETITAQVAASQYTFYYAAIPGKSDGLYTIRWIVTPISGHISFYLNCGDDDYDIPSSNSSSWSLAPVTLAGYVDISSLSLQDKGCIRRSSDGATFYASVYGDTAASFSLTVHELNNVTGASFLRANLAVNNVVGSKQIQYYYFRPGAFYEDVRLVATAMQGDVDLYVSHSWDKRPIFSKGVISSFDFKSASFGNEDLKIKHDKIENFCGSSALNSPCYFIVAVVGVSALTSRYSLTYTLQDSTLVLQNGLPSLGNVDSGRYQYYKFSLYQPSYDVLISVSAIVGDPDVYIGLKPITHPKRDNFTWISSKLGSDSMTIQYDDLIQEGCIPSGRSPCDLFVGIYGWRNSSYSVTASILDGFLSPIALLDSVSQSGSVELSAYQYYQYFVSVDAAHNNSLPKSIKIVLTPTDGGDVDLYVRFARPGGRNISEPGKEHFDYRSTSWSNVAEVIEISVDMPNYCIDCLIYVAVYGYTKGAYTIQASSTGMLSLVADHSVGGNVVQGQFQYYSLYNPDIFAEMTMTLTAVYGDADLYVTTRKAGEKQISIPSKTNYIWRSLNSGSDNLQINYDDSKFCSDCEYIIGIYGYRNCTYTLIFTSHKSSLVKLAPNRPQLGVLDKARSLQYFTTYITSSTADMTITLTALNTGSADMYVQIYNATAFVSGAGNDDMRFPDPSDYTSYQYTTAGTEEDHISIPGPHNIEDVIVIAVVAIQPVRFLLIAASSEIQTLLQSGIPQYHYVEQGQMEYFRLYPDDDTTDLRITVTARTGDPDLFASTKYSNPHCSAVDSSPWQVHCSNFTWSSRMFYTDQIIISRDYPCEPVIPSTYVSPDCDATQPLIADVASPLYIGVYGYKASKYSILAAPVGQLIQLLSGQPQFTATAPGFICDKRSLDTGTCLATARMSKKVQVAYFSFYVAPSEKKLRRTLMDTADVASVVSDVLLTVISQCNASSNAAATQSTKTYFATRDNNDWTAVEHSNAVAVSAGSCAPGCNCNPLKVYVNSCPISRCTELDRKPSEYNNQHTAVMTVSAENRGSTMYLSPGAPGYCDPSKANEECAYYIAISHTDAATVASFSVTARTARDINLIPCDAINYPDNIRFTTVDYLAPVSSKSKATPATATAHYYEVCSQDSSNTGKASGSGSGSTGNEKMIIEIEQCSAGDVTVYACADDNKCAAILPSSTSYAFKADKTQSCVHSFASKTGKDTCTKTDGDWPHLVLPPRQGGNYFLMTQGTGYHTVTVKNTMNNVEIAPTMILANFMAAKTSTAVKVTAVSDKTMSVTWQQARVVIPGYSTPIIADLMTYRVYLFNTAKVNFQDYADVFSPATFCGLQRAEAHILPTATSASTGLSVIAVPVSTPDMNQDVMSHTFSGLKSGSKYFVVIAAVCDSNCLRQVSKVLSSQPSNSPNGPNGSAKRGFPLVNCNSHDADCKPQNIVYAGIPVSTTGGIPTNTDDNTDTTNTDTSHDDTGIHTVVIVGIVLVVFMVMVMIAVYVYWYKLRQVYEDFYPLGGDSFSVSVSEMFSSLSSFFTTSFTTSSSASTTAGYGRVGVNSSHGNSAHGNGIGSLHGNGNGNNGNDYSTEMVDLKRGSAPSSAGRKSNAMSNAVSNPVWDKQAKHTNTPNTNTKTNNAPYAPPSTASTGLQNMWSNAKSFVSTASSSATASAYRPVASSSEGNSSLFVVEDDDEDVEVNI